VSGVQDSDRFTIIPGDLTSPDVVRRAVQLAGPDRVYHLAAQSYVPDSFADPMATLHNNLAGLVNVLEAVRAIASGARILVVSSSEVYGRLAGAAPIGERAEFRPENPYAVSKAAQDLLGYQYHVAYGLDVVRVRPFNHIGPGQSDRFVASNFARQIAEIETGMHAPVIQVGNLAARRDFTDVRDMVQAYEAALLKGDSGAAYNLGQGSSVPVRSLLDYLVARSRVPVTVQVDPSRLRPADAPVLECDGRRFRETTGWKPQIPLEQTLDDILDYWRLQIADRRS
jgi:GDP-4-dehydro-6-deoxy-D-mannose reductase